MGVGITYLPLLVLNCSLMRPTILSCPSGSMRARSPEPQLPIWMSEQVTLNGSGHHVLALAGFELLLDAADDLELPVGIDAGQIAGAEESVRRKASPRAFRVLVVAQHVHGAADEEFLLTGEPCLHARDGAARSEEHTSELQSLRHLVCRLLL